MSIEIDNDSGEIRVDGYEYATTKVKVKAYGISSESSQTGNSADLRLTDSDGYTDNVTFTGGTNVTIVRTDANKITISASANDTNTTYGISAETNVTPKSADIRLTGSDATTDNVALVGGTNVTITRTDANTITFSATDIDTNTKYSISSETSQTGNSVDLRLSDTDGYTDNVTITGGSNVTITKDSASKFTIDSYNSDTTYSIEASSSASPLGAKISLKDSNSVMDNVFIVQGTGVSVSYTGGPDAITVANTGVTQINQGTGITVSGQTGNVTVNNDGVTKFNGAKGSVDYYSFSQMTDGYNTAIADAPNDTFRFNAGSGITTLVSSGGDSITIGNDGVRTFNGSKGDISFSSFGAITDGYNTAIADWPMDTLNVAGGSGISVAVDGYTDSLTISNTGVRQNIAGTGISVSSGTGNVTINNTGVTQFNGATGNISYNSFGTIFDGYNTATADQANDTITFIAGSGIGVLVNSPGDNLTISNTGVRQAIAGTGISVSSGTGNVTIGNTGVTAITPGTGITTSGSGNITVNNDGVTTFNTVKGAITYNSFGTISDGYNTATADQATDTVNFIAGTGIGVLVNGPGDSLTISNTGVTSLNGGTGAQYTYSTFTDGTTPTTAGPGNTTMTLTGSNGIKVTTSPNTATVSMSQVSIVRGTDATIGFGAITSILSTNVIPISTTVEIQGVILLAFSNAAAANTYTVSLTTSSGTIGGNTSKVGLGFAAHAGPTAGSPGETTKQAPSFTYPQQIANTNDHTLRFSGLFQTDGTTPNSLVINIRNNCLNGGENLVVYAKSFMKYNVI